jgi:hypothetical protein
VCRLNQRRRSDPNTGWDLFLSWQLAPGSLDHRLQEPRFAIIHAALRTPPRDPQRNGKPESLTAFWVSGPTECSTASARALLTATSILRSTNAARDEATEPIAVEHHPCLSVSCSNIWQSIACCDVVVVKLCVKPHDLREIRQPAGRSGELAVDQRDRSTVPSDPAPRPRVTVCDHNVVVEKITEI